MVVGPCRAPLLLLDRSGNQTRIFCAMHDEGLVLPPR